MPQELQDLTNPASVTGDASDSLISGHIRIRARVLIIDDDRLVAASLRRLLARDHDVVVAISGAEALNFLHTDARVDVIFCDLNMPEMDGMEIYETLRRERPELISRIVFITGGAFSDDAAAFLDRIPNRRLTKPFNFPEVRAAVQSSIKPPRDNAA